MKGRRLSVLLFAAALDASLAAAAEKRFAIQADAGLGAFPYGDAEAYRRGFDASGRLSWRLSRNSQTYWLEGGAEYRSRPARQSFFADKSPPYVSGGEVTSRSVSLRLRRLFYADKRFFPYGALGVRLASDRKTGVRVRVGNEIFEYLKTTSERKAVFSGAIGLQFRLGGSQDILAEFQFDGGTNPLPAPVWNVRLGYRLGVW